MNCNYIHYLLQNYKHDLILKLFNYEMRIPISVKSAYFRRLRRNSLWRHSKWKLSSAPNSTKCRFRNGACWGRLWLRLVFNLTIWRNGRVKWKQIKSQQPHLETQTRSTIHTIQSLIRVFQSKKPNSNLITIYKFICDAQINKFELTEHTLHMYKHINCLKFIHFFSYRCLIIMIAPSLIPLPPLTSIRRGVEPASK